MKHVLESCPSTFQAELVEAEPVLIEAQFVLCFWISHVAYHFYHHYYNRSAKAKMKKLKIYFS